MSDNNKLKDTVETESEKVSQNNDSDTVNNNSDNINNTSEIDIDELVAKKVEETISSRLERERFKFNSVIDSKAETIIELENKIKNYENEKMYSILSDKYKMDVSIVKSLKGDTMEELEKTLKNISDKLIVNNEPKDFSSDDIFKGKTFKDSENDIYKKTLKSLKERLK